MDTQLNNDKIKARLYEEFSTNSKILDEISLCNKDVEELKAKINSLRHDLDQKLYKLQVLQEIKESQKTFLIIDKRISEYIQSISRQEMLNTWKKTFETNNKTFATEMYNIKNATYTGSIILNIDKKVNTFTVNFELEISSLLLNFVKNYKQKLTEIDDVKIFKEGKVFFSEKESNKYIENMKEKYIRFFKHEKAPLFKKFKDISKNSYSYEDFLMYDNNLITGYSTIEFDVDTSIEIPF